MIVKVPSEPTVALSDGSSFTYTRIPSALESPPLLAKADCAAAGDSKVPRTREPFSSKPEKGAVGLNPQAAARRARNPTMSITRDLSMRSSRLREPSDTHSQMHKYTAASRRVGDRAHTWRTVRKITPLRSRTIST